ncbi:MAG: hypothetical protein GTO14_11750 [Anaerolineales bacterium]|nr:hypothetical protein [Anaerolineales bacterium]
MELRRPLPQTAHLMLLMLLLTSCVTLQQTPTSIPIPATVTSTPILVTPASSQTTATSKPILPTHAPLPTDTPFPELTATMSPSQTSAPSYRVQMTISTTSDWTEVRLIEGGIWYDLTVVMASEHASSGGFEGDRLVLSQPIIRAEVGKSVELIVDVFITELDPQGALVFEIERGHLGSTQVELSIYRDEIPREIAVLSWDGIKPSGRNAQVYEISSEAFTGERPNEYIVIGQLNFWYFGPGKWGGFEDAYGNRITPLNPLLGDYWASDPAVVYQQIEWAVEYGVDAFSIEWTTPRGIGTAGSLEDTLDDVFLKSPNVHKIRWAIFYDFVLRVDQTPGLEHVDLGRIDFDLPDVYDTFVSDFVHFSEKYFDHPQYLTIDGRPVIYIWATSSFTGDFAGAMQEARERVSELGYDVFIVGDEVCIGCFNADHASLFDGSSTFTFLIPGLDVSWADVGEAAVAVDGAFRWWRDRIAGLRVAGRVEFVNFQPAWAPQYDDHLFVPQHPTTIPATSKEQVVAMAMVARKHAQPIGSSGLRLVWLNTWNNWAETTTVEPTANLGPKYPAGNYQFDMLEVVREVFGDETYYTSPLP